MAIYDKKIDRHTDWGGDKSTNYLPVAGGRVQELIKSELNNKIGAFYKPAGGNQIYCFASTEDKDNYLLTLDESLIVDVLETESLYKVEVNTDTLAKTVSVMYGETGNTISFQFKIEGNAGLSPDSKATIEYKFEAGGTIVKYTEQVDISTNGWTTVNSSVIDDYLKIGINNVMVSITGNRTKTYGEFRIVYKVFELSYVPDFNYNIGQADNSLTIPYTLVCSEKPIKIKSYLDGVEITSAEAVINEYSKEGVINVPITNLEPGRHTYQTYACVETTDDVYRSNLYYYTFAVAGDGEPTFLMEKKFNNKKELVQTGELLTVDIEEFEEYRMNWAMYDFKKRRHTVKFEYNNKPITSVVYYANGTGEINEFSFKPLEHGNNLLLRIYSEDENGDVIFEDGILFNVKESTTGLKETTDGLLLKLMANGRRNTDENHNSWTYKGVDNVEYSTTFHNFAWTKQQGWNEDYEALVISDDAYIEIDIRPMLTDWANNGMGGTVEIDLETFDVEDDDAVICECKDEVAEEETKQSYFSITATKAEFSTTNGSKIFTRYKDNERLKIAFIGNRQGPNEDHNLIYIMVNGVLERAALYNSDTIVSDSYLRIGCGNGGCKVKLYSIRVYNRAITVDEEFNNFVIDSKDSQIIYEKNDVIKDGSTNRVGFDKVANKLPVMIFTGDMIKLMEEGQSTKPSGVWYLFDVEYINRQDPDRNFVAFNCQMKLQGTSSLGYPRKNFKLKTKNKNFNNDADVNYYLDKYEVDFENTEEGNRRLYDKTTGRLLDFGELETGCLMYVSGGDFKGRPLHKGRYKFRENSHNATKWTLKADFMESSCSHNVAAGRSWNEIFEDTVIKPGKGYSNQTYRREALNLESCDNDGFVRYNKNGVDYEIPYNTLGIQNQEDFVCRTEAQKICHVTENAEDVRTAVDGFPMVCYYRTSHNASEEDWVFMGQYNFINDKGSYEVFGFEDIEDPNYDGDNKKMIYDASKVECWEGLRNTSPISMFINIDNWMDPNSGYSTTYEARYPDPEDVDVDSTALYELSDWLVSTRHEDDTVYSDGQIYIDSTFAKWINLYQYGYNNDTKDKYKYPETGWYPDTPENRQLKFNTEKWEHFDMWKVAGYYIYLMRYGAVDQFVKNTMLFTDGNGKYDTRTEDKRFRKWYFINYDNDCLFGLRNNGKLAFNWDIDRQTEDREAEVDPDLEEEAANSYAMMGHDSTLWNNLEKDEEFMRMVYDLDNSMHIAGLTYEKIVEEFDTKQTEKWCERIYNANERYKYIQAAKATGDMSGKTPVDNLWMLQGTRRSHRHWWVANRFNYLDAKWLSGDYKNDYVLLKIQTDRPTHIYGIAGCDYYFAYGTQKAIIGSNISKKEGETVDYYFEDNQAQGDPLLIYAPNKLSELDASGVAQYLFDDSFNFSIASTNVTNRLKRLIIGNTGVTVNAKLQQATWSALNNLEYLDITNVKSISNFDYSSFKRLHTLKAFGTELSNFEPADGSKIELVELPGAISTISLKNIVFNSFATDFKYTPTINLKKVELDNVSSKITNDYFEKIIRPWIEKIEASSNPSTIYRRCSLKIGHVAWSFNEFSNASGTSWFDLLEKFKNNVTEDEINPNFSIDGVIDLRECGALKLSDIDRIKAVFGNDCFNETSGHIYIRTPESIFIHSENESMVAGKTNIFTREIYPDESALDGLGATISYYLVKEVDDSPYIDYANGGKKYMPLTDEEIRDLRPYGGNATIFTNNTVDSSGHEIFEVSTTEVRKLQDTQLKVMALLKIGDTNKISVCDFLIKDPTYAVDGVISGERSMHFNSTYTFTMSLADASGNKPIGTEIVTWSINASEEILNTYIASTHVSEDTLEFTIETTGNQPEISEAMTIVAHVEHGLGNPFNREYKTLMLNENVIMTTETNPVAMGICKTNRWVQDGSDAMLKSDAASVTNEMLSTAFTMATASTFTFNEFVYFTGITALPDYAFRGSKIKEITLPHTIETIGVGAFENCSLLETINTKTSDGTIEANTLDNITEIKARTFLRCSKLSKLILSYTITRIEDLAFGGTNFTKALIGEEKLDNGILILSRNITEIQGSAFEVTDWSIINTTNKLKVIELPLKLKLTTSNGFNILYGKYYEEYLVEEILGGQQPYYKSIDGVLYNAALTELVKYPAKKERTSENEVYSTGNLDFVLERLMSYAFLFVENVDEVITTRAVTALGEHCFETCKIKSIDLSNSTNITYIPRYTFSNCNLLEHIYLPVTNSLQTLNLYAFNNCPNVHELAIPNGVKTLETHTVGSSINSEIFVNVGVTEIVLPDTITSLGYNIADSCADLTYFKFPSNVTLDVNRNYNYVKNCYELERVKLPLSSYYDNIYYMIIVDGEPLETVYETEQEALDALAALGVEGTVELHRDNVVVNSTFSPNIVGSAPNLEEYILPDNDNGETCYIYDGCIYGAGNKLIKVPFGKTSVDIQDGVKSIEELCFSNCGKLTGLTLPDSVEEVKNEAFSRCNSLVELKIPSGVTVIPFGFINASQNLETLYLTGNVTNIGNIAFGGCLKLRNIYIFSEEAPALGFSDITNTQSFVNNGEYAGYQTKGLGNTIYILHGATGYDYDTPKYRVYNPGQSPVDYWTEEEAIAAVESGGRYEYLDNRTGSWMDPARNPEKCGYAIEAIHKSNPINIKIYSNGTLFNNEWVYVKSEYNEIGAGGASYSAGHFNAENNEYNVPVNKLYHGEDIYVYSDLECTDLIGTLTVDFFEDEYMIGEPALGLGTRSTKGLSSGKFSQQILGSEENGSDTYETVTLSKSEYVSIISNLNYLNGIINDFLAK